MPGEGTFHQFHGGVTTGGDSKDRRAELIKEIRDQYGRIRGQDFERPETQPIYLGYMPRQAIRFLELSCAQVREHERQTTDSGWTVVDQPLRQAKTR